MLRAALLATPLLRACTVRLLSPAPALLVRPASRLARRRRSPPSPPPPPRPGTVQHAQGESERAVAPGSLVQSSEHEATSLESAPPVPSELPIARPALDVPRDPHGVLDRATGSWVEPLRTLLSQSSIVVARQLEPLNIFIGWEEANRYQLHAPNGAVLGYLLEEESSVVGTMSRQLLRTHRPFRAIVLSPDGEVLLRIRRPFSWINSRIFVSTPTSSSSSALAVKDELQRLEGPDRTLSSTSLTVRAPEDAPPQRHDQDDGEVIGETQQVWALMRRRYDHFVARDSGNGNGNGERSFEQFGQTDSGFLAWDFTVRDEAGAPIGSINRNFAGFGRELFTDTGQYVLRFEGVVDELTPRIPAPASGPTGLLPGPEPVSAPRRTTEGTSTALERTSADYSSTGSDGDRALAAEKAPSLPLDHRAVLLASAVSIDFDYFTRHRGGLLGGGGGLFMPMPFPVGGYGGPPGEPAPEAGAGQGDVPPPPGPMPSSERDPSEPEYGSGTVRPAGENAPMAGDDELMRDPWASEDLGRDQEGGTWGWNDVFGDDQAEDGSGEGGWGDGGGDW